MEDETETFEVFLIGGDDDETATFTMREAGSNCELQCAYRGKVAEAVSADFFEALCSIRAILAGDALIPFCYGASLNVYPSPMARDMGGGLKAYKLAMGSHAKTSDLVDIFAEGPDVIPASVELQAQYYSDWLASIGAAGA